MGRVFDEKDYRRRLDELDSSNISVGQEAGLIWEGWVSGSGSGPLDAKKDILAAKQNALRQARKAMIKEIRAADDAARANNAIPTSVEEIVTGSTGDDFVKVP